LPVYIQQIATALPTHRYDAEQITRFLITSAQTEEAARKVKLVARKSGIQSRYSVLNDFNFPNERALFNGHNPKVEERMRTYQREALPLTMQAIRKLEGLRPAEITHVITVSCTGLSAPGLELQIAQELELDQNCARHAVNFIGCHGAFHALKMARQMALADSQARILIVSVELCSLHFQPSEDDDSILANALFGDGAAACIVSSENPTGIAIQMDGFSQRFFPNDSQLMAWNIHSDGFLLKLSSYVPKVLELGIADIFEHEGRPDSSTSWAVHPGGKNILEAVETGLKLDKGSLDASRQVLEEVGNLSSATILFVLKKLMESAVSDRNLQALGFGPGITIEHLYGKIRV